MLLPLFRGNMGSLEIMNKDSPRWSHLTIKIYIFPATTHHPRAPIYWRPWTANFLFHILLERFNHNSASVVLSSQHILTMQNADETFPIQSGRISVYGPISFSEGIHYTGPCGADRSCSLRLQGHHLPRAR